MITIQGQVRIKAPSKRVFQVFSRVEDWPEWWPGCDRAQLEGAWKFGAGLPLTLVPHKMTHRLRARVSGYKPPFMAAFDWSRMGVLGRFIWAFADQEGGCLVEERIELKGLGLFLFRGLGQVEALGNMVQRNLDGLKTQVESAED